MDFYRVEAEAVPDLSLKVREKMCRSPRYDADVSESILSLLDVVVVLSMRI